MQSGWLVTGGLNYGLLAFTLLMGKWPTAAHPPWNSLQGDIPMQPDAWPCGHMRTFPWQIQCERFDSIT